VLCCNILEHVQDARGFADIVSRLVPADGYLVVSVPHSYPFHADPIDTLFRPAPDEVVTMFGPTFAPVVAHTLVDTTWLQDLTRALGPRRLPGFFARDLAKAAREALSATASSAASLPLARSPLPDLHRHPEAAICLISPAFCSRP